MHSSAAAPARPVGRERELELLRAAVEAAASGARRVVLISAGAGVGKSSLIQQLQPLAQARDGWFVAGKFDQNSEREATAVVQAMGALGRLVLNQPPEERARLGGKIVRVLGPQAGLARIVPEFATLLSGVLGADTVDPAHATARMAEVVAGLLRAAVSPLRPLVLVLDDLHWGGTLATRLIDTVLAAPDLAGLVLVGAYRADGLSANHPLASAISRWTEDPAGPRVLKLGNLQTPQIAQLLAQSRGLPPLAAMRLAEALAQHAGGNPGDTLELANALADDGLVTGPPERAQWDDAQVRLYLARTSVRQVLAAGIARLAGHPAQLLRTLACIGAQVGRDVALAAVALAPEDFESALQDLCERGFVLGEQSHDGVLRLRHEGVQQAAYASLPQGRRAAFHLVLARRLAAHSGLTALAADQYQLAVDEMRDPAECVRAAGIVSDAAAQARLIGNFGVACRLLDAALKLLEFAQQAGGGDPVALAGCEIGYHLALFSVGRMDEADTMFRRIEQRYAQPLKIVEAACLQIRSLTHRNHLAEAIALGLRLLRELGIHVPDDAGVTVPDFSAKYGQLRAWVETFDLARESARPEPASPQVPAAARIIARLMLTANFQSANLHAWLVFQAQELWEEHGPCPQLVFGLCQAHFVATTFAKDLRTGYRGMRLALDMCEARGWTHEAAMVRLLFSSYCSYWFEPVDRTLREAERATESMLADGDLPGAAFAARMAANCMLESSYSLGRYMEASEAAFSLARRADTRLAVTRCLADRQFLRSLFGAGTYPAMLDSHREDEDRYLSQDLTNGWMMSYQITRRALACLIFADGAGLSRQMRHARELSASVTAFVADWSLYWWMGLAAAWELDAGVAGSVPADAQLLVELDACIEWLRQRAVDAPFNFRYMHLHLLAERGWAVGDHKSAMLRFDQAIDTAEENRRHWQQAVITERAARFHLEQGWTTSGSQLLLEAQRLFAHWGLTARAAELSAQTADHASARPRLPAPFADSALSGLNYLDGIAVLTASQALNSERSPARLKAKVQEVLGSLMGATRVELVLWDEDSGNWTMGAAESGPMPLSALRYALRTREQLLVADALADDRFARDVYFRGVAHCAMMVMPILHGESVRAMLLLENRAIRGAFDTAHRSAAAMIAGQLSLALENTYFFERLERKASAQTRQLRDAQAHLVGQARAAGMAHIAANVLHNVGNLLTSVNVSTHVLASRVRQSRAARVQDIVQLLADNEGDVAGFFRGEGKGGLLPGYVRELAGALQGERETLLAELSRLGASVDNIKAVVALQQAYAGAGGFLEPCSISELVDDALRLQQESLARQDVVVTREESPTPRVPLDKARVMQILLNLIENARQAVEGGQGKKTLNIEIRQKNSEVLVAVSDNGCGIAQDDLRKVFAHGFTTRKSSHGFGLHSCAVAAIEMGGTLRAKSEGRGTGATFTLALPLAAQA